VDSNGYIQKADSTEAFVTRWGTTGTGNGQLSAPIDIAVRAGGLIYVTEFSGYRVTAFQPQVVGVDGPAVAVSRLTVHPCSPNPAAAFTEIRFDLADAAKVDIAIYDARGRLVRRALAGERLMAGAQTWRWDARDARGANVAPGIYQVVVRDGDVRAATKVVVLR
jgi:hypothetical protein